MPAPSVSTTLMLIKALLLADLVSASLLPPTLWSTILPRVEPLLMALPYSTLLVSGANLNTLPSPVTHDFSNVGLLNCFGFLLFP